MSGELDCQRLTAGARVEAKVPSQHGGIHHKLNHPDSKNPTAKKINTTRLTPSETRNAAPLPASLPMEREPAPGRIVSPLPPPATRGSSMNFSFSSGLPATAVVPETPIQGPRRVHGWNLQDPSGRHQKPQPHHPHCPSQRALGVDKTPLGPRRPKRSMGSCGGTGGRQAGRPTEAPFSSSVLLTVGRLLFVAWTTTISKQSKAKIRGWCFPPPFSPAP